MAQKLTIQCKDGYSLQASFYPSSGQHALIINAAMGVSQRFYQQFAEYLSSNGIAVLTYDYRGLKRKQDNPKQSDILKWWRRTALVSTQLRI